MLIKRKFYGFGIGIIALLFLNACQSKQDVEDFQLNTGKAYTPIDLNSSWMYEVDSILFKKDISGISTDTMKYIFYDQVIDFNISPNGDSVFIIERKKVSSSAQTIEVYQVKTNGLHYVHAIDNQNFISFVYPPRLGKRWNGLSLFNATEWIEFILNDPIRKFKDWTDFRITDIDLSITQGSKSFDKVIKVLQTDVENAIERRYSCEMYAPNVGLIFKEKIILDTQNISSEPWDKKAERGFILRQTLISE